MDEWITVCMEADVPPGHAARIEIGDTPIALFNVNGAFYCLDDTCSHAEASLSDGDLDTRKCVIECPLHGSAFDLRTGEPLSLPAVEPVNTHPVEVVNGELRIAIETQGEASA